MAGERFDYIIVGGGSAGCVLAERLSRGGANSVLLLEAGSANNSLFIHMPRGFMKILYHPNYYWKFPIEAQEDRDAGETWHYGKGLGGSSAVNGTWYFRGMPGDFNQWEGMGCTGWNWDIIERAYRQMEDYQEQGAHASRGRGGPLQITNVTGRGTLTEAILEAGRQLQIPVLDDVNTPGTEVVGITQMTVDRSGRRASAHRTFLRDRAGRRLTVRTGALVEKVLFEGRRATGVRVRSATGPATEIMAGEVILSAGVLQTPKLLQLSGIGDPDLLAEHGIPLVHANREVGRNLVDHMMLRMSFELKGDRGMNHEFHGLRLMKNVAQYYLTRKGIMASNPPNVSAMISSTGDRSWPDIQIGIGAFSRVSHSDGREVGSPATEKTPGITAVSFYLRPESRGTVEIRSTDAADMPKVRPHWWSDPRDRQHYIDMFNITRRFMRQPALAPFVGQERIPGAHIVTDEQIMANSPALMTTGLHHTGTARMGAEGWGVVDPSCRVWGVQNLRVIDCSTMPTSMSGNTNGPAMALAWRAADLILAERAQGARAAG